MSNSVVRDAELGVYLDQVGRIPMISAAEELSLARRAREGDLEARNRLVEAHLRFVVQVAKAYRGRGLSFLDLIEEGNLGLVRATERFDPDRGYRFLSYAVWWIRQSIVQALIQHGRLVRIPAYRHKRIQKARRQARRLRRELGREPSVDEIAGATDLPADVVREDAGMARQHLSLDSELENSDEGRTFLHLLPEKAERCPDAVCRTRIQAERIHWALKRLPDRQSRILRLYFGLEGNRRHTLEEIGNHFGFTRENARQIKEKGLASMRSILADDALLAAVG